MTDRFRSRLWLRLLDRRDLPALFTVSSAADGVVTGPGQLPGSLRQALFDANTLAGADTISVSSFVSTINLSAVAGELIVSDAITIEKPTGVLTISGGNSIRVMNTSSAPAGTLVSLHNLTLTAGKATTGAGLQIGDESVSLINCSITSSSASINGGAIFVTSPTALTLSDCTIKSNGISTPSNNGGGIYLNTDATVTLTRSVVSENTSTLGGGGMYFRSGGGLAIDGGEISRNISPNGGAGIQFLGTVGSTGFTILNSTVSSNSSTSGSGAGILLSSFTGTLTVQNSTITANSAGGVGAGIARASGTGSISIESTIVSGNFHGSTPDISSSGIVQAKASAIGSAAGFTLTDLGGNLAFGTPLSLGALAANGGKTQSHLPAVGSAVVNKGSNPTGLTSDQRGNPFDRVRGTGIDIGAVEALTSLLVVNADDSGVGSFRQAILASNAFAGTETIEFDPAVFATGQTITLTTQLTMTDATTIDGPTSGKATIDANGLGRAMSFSPVSGSILKMSDLIITGGATTTAGGLLVFGQHTVTLTRMSFEGNSVSGNGGGVVLQNVASVTVIDSTFANNTAQNGAGVGVVTTALAAAPIVVNGSTFVGNTASNQGGGLFLSSPGVQTTTIRNSTFSQNSANSGGAIGHAAGGSLTVQNSTILNNSAASFGGGLRSSPGSGSVVVESAVVSGNSAPTGPDIDASSTLTLNQSAVGDAAGFSFTGSGNLAFGLDLKLGPLADNFGPTRTHLPDRDSPLLDVGSNPSLTSRDQRGFARVVNGTADIGAVEAQVATVVSAVRLDASPTKAATVSWSVILSAGVVGVTPASFALSGPGATGASITSVTGGPLNWTVVAMTGSDGALGLNMVSDAGLSHYLTNLPFAGEAYTIDKSPPIVTVTPSVTTISDQNFKLFGFELEVSFSEPVDPANIPVISFPTEDPGLTLNLASAGWSAGKYKVVYHVTDYGITLPNIDVRVVGGEDLLGNVHGTTDLPDVFGIDMTNPIVTSIVRDDPSPTNALLVSWTVIFSEPVTGLSASNLAMFVGGLGGAPAITAVTGSGTTWTVEASTGTGDGTLAFYIVNSIGLADQAGNPALAVPVVSPAYTVDHVAPAAAQVSLSTLVVTDAEVGPAGFAVTIRYNEIMDPAVAPVVTFPVENPGATLTPTGGAWLDAKTYQAKFNVADFGLDLSDIDIAIAGGQDAVGNVQGSLTLTDALDVDMVSPVVTGVSINNGAAQRSRVTELAVSFDRIVSFAGPSASAFELRRQSDLLAVTLSAAVDNTGPGTVVTLTFLPGSAVDFGSLADGRYTLTVFSDQVSSGGGILDGDGNGTAGDDYVLAGTPSNGLFRLFGDFTGNGQVASDDFLAFRLAFLTSGSAFDFDGSGLVDSADFLQFRLRFLMMI